MESQDKESGYLRMPFGSSYVPGNYSLDKLEEMRRHKFNVSNVILSV